MIKKKWNVRIIKRFFSLFSLASARFGRTLSKTHHLLQYLWIVNHNYLSPCISLFDRFACHLSGFFILFFISYFFCTTIIGLCEGQFNVFISRASWYIFHLRLIFFSFFLTFSPFLCGVLMIQTCNKKKATWFHFGLMYSDRVHAKKNKPNAKEISKMI